MVEFQVFSMEFVVNGASLLMLQIGFSVLCAFIGNNLILYPVRRRRSTNNLNALQIICYSIISGMAFLIVFLQIMSFLCIAVSVAFILTLGLSTSITIFRVIEYRRQGGKLGTTLKPPTLPTLILICVFIIVNILAFSIPNGLAGSTNSDAAYHTFFIRIILENDLVIAYPYPYFEYLLFHPSGPHVLGALLTWLGFVPIQATVVSMGAIFPALVVLGGYSLTKTLSNNEYAALAAAIFMIASNDLWHPLSYTFTVQMIEFAIVAGGGLMIWLLSETNSFHQIAISSLILAFAAYIHPIAVLYLLLIGGGASILIAAYPLKKSHLSLDGIRRISKLLIVPLLALLLWIPFGMVTYTFLNNSTVGLPNDWLIPAERETFDSSNPYGLVSSFISPVGDIWNPVSWIQEATRHGGFYFLAILAILLVPAAWLLAGDSDEEKRKVARICLSTLALLIAFFSILIYLEFFLGNITIVKLFHPPRAWEMLFIPLSIASALTLILIHSLASSVQLESVRRLSFSVPGKRNRKVFAVLMLTLSGFILVMAHPFHNQRSLGGTPYYVQSAYDNVRLFNRLTLDDMNVFGWIIDNTSLDSVFLVSQVDAGEYLTSVTHRVGIYPFGPAGDSSTYRRLCLGLTVNPSNPYLLSLLNHYNISYVFAGSLLAESSTPTWGKQLARRGGWTKDSLSVSPFLEEVYSSGKSAVFEVRYGNTTVEGPTLSALSEVSTLTNCTTLSGWIGVGAAPYLDNNTFLTSITNQSIGVNLTGGTSFSYLLQDTWIFENSAHAILWLQSSSECTLSIQFVDSVDRRIIHRFELNSSWSPIVANLRSTSTDELENLIAIHFVLDESSANNCAVNIAYVGIAGEQMNLASFAEYNEHTGVVNYFTDIERLGTSLVFLPDFVEPTAVEPATISWLLYPENIIMIDHSGELPPRIRFVNASNEVGEDALQFMPRPIEISFLEDETNPRLQPTSFSSTVGIWGLKSSEMTLITPLGMSAIHYEIEHMVSGVSYIPVFYSGSSSDGELVITVYENKTSACSRISPPQLRFVMNHTKFNKWVVLELHLEDSRGFCIRVDNHFAQGSLFVGNPLVYSYGGYF